MSRSNAKRCGCGKDTTTITKSPEGFYCDACYFRRLDKVARQASNAVADAQITRSRDTINFPFLDIQRWSWKTYNNWKARQ